MKWLRSSQVRIALVSVLTSAAGLLAFGGFAWWQMRASSIASLDRELLSLGKQTALAARWELTAAQMETALRARFGEERSRGWIFAIEERGRPTVASTWWPKTLAPQSLPHNDQVIVYDMPGRGEPGDFMLGGPHGPPPKPPSGFGLFFQDPFEDDGPDHDSHDHQPPPMSVPRLYAPRLLTLNRDGHQYRMGVFGHAETGTIIHAGLDMDVFARDLARLVNAFALALPLALILVAVGAWLAARRSLVPVQHLSREMENLSLVNLHQRLDVQGTDREFHHIIRAYNAMLGRLDRSYQQATRFSADASHELKTPLAVMRATLERALGRAKDGSVEQGTYAGMLDEIDHLQSIIEALLLLSRADAGKLVLSTERLDMAAWLRPLAEDLSLMAESRHISVHDDLEAAATVAADPVLLHRAVHNLLRNAVAYNHDGGEIWFHTRTTGSHFVITIANTGLPVPEAERERIFVRFSRGSNAGGTGEGRGLGIGLSLAREIVLAHGGTLELTGSAPDKTTFEMTLPKA